MRIPKILCLLFLSIFLLAIKSFAADVAITYSSFQKFCNTATEEDSS